MEDENPQPRPVGGLRSCIVAPAAAVLVLLILTALAWLSGPPPAKQTTRAGVNRSAPGSQAARVDAFAAFGREFFEIAHKADGVNEKAFRELQSVSDRSGSLESARVAFEDASEANMAAATEYDKLEVPQGLLSREKLEDSVVKMAAAFRMRSKACDTVVEWTRDTGNESIAQTYQQQAQEVNRLTREGLQSMGAAAEDNGLTVEDVRRFLPPPDSDPGKRLSVSDDADRRAGRDTPGSLLENARSPWPRVGRGNR